MMKKITSFMYGNKVCLRSLQAVVLATLLAISTLSISTIVLAQTSKQTPNKSDTSFASTTATKLKKTARITTKASSSTTSLKVSWDKVSGANGYIVYQSTKKNSGYKEVKITSGTSYTASNLTKNKTYYFKVMAYKTVNGKKFYGTYSSVAKGKTANIVRQKSLETKIFNKVKLDYTNEHSLEPKEIDGWRVYNVLTPEIFNTLNSYGDKFSEGKLSEKSTLNTIAKIKFFSPMELADIKKGIEVDEGEKMSLWKGASHIKKYTFSGNKMSYITQEIYIDTLIFCYPKGYGLPYVYIRAFYNRTTNKTTIYYMALNFS